MYKKTRHHFRKSTGFLLNLGRSAAGGHSTRLEEADRRVSEPNLPSNGPSNSLGSGGGLAGLGTGISADSSPHSTPPNSPLRGGEASTDGEFFCLSTKTCIELLPLMNMEQLQFELRFLKINTDALTQAELVSAIRNHLIPSLCREFTDTVNNATNTSSTFSCLVDEANKTIGKLREWTPPATATDPSDRLTTATPPTAPEESTPAVSLPPIPQVDDSVCKLYDNIFPELAVPSLLTELDITRAESHGRKTLYFGTIDYSYGTTSHKAQPYPADSASFNHIFGQMKKLDNDFDPESYTCLVTYYPDGSCQIPLHSDNEMQIAPDSLIWTVSVGGSRNLTLQNQVGPVNEVEVELRHGSVYSMSRSSQETWKHGVLPCSSTLPRISFGFRKLVVTPVVPRTKAPPIAPPERTQVHPVVPKGTHDRCFLLTDSILSSTPPALFDRVGDLRCIRRVNYKLVDIFDYESEFAISDTVILSAGVNDLSCYGMTARSLADSVCGKLQKVCGKYRDTHFIFNSVLSVNQHRHPWRNVEIGRFNRLMWELSRTVPNLSFFDGYHVLMRAPLSRDLAKVIDPRDKRGVHLTMTAKMIVTAELVNAVEYAYRMKRRMKLSNRMSNWNWPLRAEFRG